MIKQSPGSRSHPNRTRHGVTWLTAAAALTLLGSAQAVAAPPVADRVWAGCTLNAATMNALVKTLQTTSGGAIAAPDVAYIVVFSVDKKNAGQPLASPGGTFTGPVICTRATSPVVTPTEVAQTTPIPSSGTGTVTLQNVQASLLTQYILNSKFGNRFCQSVRGKVDCFDLTLP